jgi:GR25 family glycosyltransferase involved in LPS biosynthesis
MHKHNFKDYEFLTGFDREDITPEKRRIFIDKMPNANCAIILSPLECFKRIVESNNEFSLILEDDVILYENFKIKLNKYLQELPKDYDMFFIGSCCNLKILPKMIKENKHVYLKCNEVVKQWCQGATKGLDSYFVSKSCAKKLTNYFDSKYYKNNKNKINKNTDFLLNDVIRELNLKVYWAEPAIVKQGSEVDLFDITYNIRF